MFELCVERVEYTVDWGETVIRDKRKVPEDIPLSIKRPSGSSLPVDRPARLRFSC